MKLAVNLNHPYELTDKDIERIEACLEDRLDMKWVSTDELDAYMDMLYDVIASQKQTVPGSVVLQ